MPVDIKRAALVACVAAALATLMPWWDAVQSITALGSTTPPWWMMPVTVLMSAFAMILPIFYFALYRNAGDLRPPKRLGSLALMAAAAFGLLVAIGLPEWIGSLVQHGTSVLTPNQGAWAIRDVAAVVSEISNVAQVLVLIAIFRQATDESYSHAPVSNLLILITRVAVIAWGAWVAFNIVRFVLTPYTYYSLKNFAFQAGRTPIPFRVIFADAARTLLSQACLFVAPYIVWRSLAQSKPSIFTAR